MSIFRRLILSLAATALVIPLVATTSTAAPAGRASIAAAGRSVSAPVSTEVATPPVIAAGGCSVAWYQNDRRLGPAVLSVTGRAGAELRGYRRTGGLSVAKFLSKYWDNTVNNGQGGWLYPKNDGFLSDPKGKPITKTATLTPGTLVDRYGSEYGAFLAPGGVAYSKRAIPPSNLVGTPASRCNYANYRVLKEFAVTAGPIAPWFGQPGRGIQYQLKGSLVSGAPEQLNVLWLVEAGYLARVPAPGSVRLS